MRSIAQIRYGEPTDPPLSWGISVRVSELGGALQAFKETLPACNTFRLCHRFGKGSKVHLARLPRELVEEIIDHVVGSAISDSVEAWNEDFRCFEGSCTRETHITDDIIDEAEEKALIDAGSCHEGEADCAHESCSVDLDEHVEENLDQLATSEHHWRIRRWKSRSLQLTQHTPEHQLELPSWEICNDMSEILRCYFGVRALVSHKFGADDIQHTLDYTLRSTTCYITVPSESSDPASDDTDCHRMAATVDPSRLVLSDAALTRLNHVMHVLHLKPYVHPVQIGLQKAHESYELEYRAKCLHQIHVRDLEKLLLQTAQTYADSKWPKMISHIPEPGSYRVVQCACGMCSDDEELDDETIEWDLRVPALEAGRAVMREAAT